MVEVGLIPYSKMVLHAVKYPHCAVRGVLLGETKTAEEASSSGSVAYKIVDAIPALHNSLLSPQMEILLIHLDAYCQENKLKIVGFYFANQQATDTSFDDILGRFAMEKMLNPIVLQVENTKLCVNTDISALHAYVNDGKWKNQKCELEGDDEILASASRAIENKLYRELADFENYLEQPNMCDFYNTELNLKLESLV
ncbi:ER membrane protein complex subunit 8 [Ditylenchus destructor]|uniref:ER membrane protein complex subunit 8 n=1 Tax=Ditylenchus destructor TaxID=166010 RepID=A0AAD4ND27_9BILA|nr:ER membrane protein complex subunit 8 [Ditylenchus destructor]